MIDPDVVLGRNVHIHNPEQVNIFGCEIGDDSFVGFTCKIVGNDAKKSCIIESHSFLCTGVVLENNVFVGHGAMFTNDLFPRTDRHVVYPTTLVKRFASIGTNATVLGGVTIGEHAVVGAGAVVTRDVPPLSIVVGSPAKVTRQFNSLSELKEYICGRQATN